MRRRQFLYVMVAGTSLAAGCIGSESEPGRPSPTSAERTPPSTTNAPATTDSPATSPDLSTTIDTSSATDTATTIDTSSATDTATTTEPPLSSTARSGCDSNYERVAVERGSVTEQLDGLVLSTGTSSVQLGAEIRFTLTNESAEEKETGNRSKYDIQRRNDGGWQSIFWEPTDEQVGYSDELVFHSPGEGFTWEFTLNRDVLSHDIQNGVGHLIVCDPLLPGVYRFVFFGKTSYDEEGPEAVLGTQFRIKGG